MKHRLLLLIMLFFSPTLLLGESDKEASTRLRELLKPDGWNDVREANNTPVSPAILTLLRHPELSEVTYNLTIALKTEIPSERGQTREDSIRDNYRLYGLKLNENDLKIIENKPQFFSYEGSFERDNQEWFFYTLTAVDRDDLLYATYVTGEKSHFKIIKDAAKKSELEAIRFYEEQDELNPPENSTPYLSFVLLLIILIGLIFLVVRKLKGKQ